MAWTCPWARHRATSCSASCRWARAWLQEACWAGVCPCCAGRTAVYRRHPPPLAARAPAPKTARPQNAAAVTHCWTLACGSRNLSSPPGPSCLPPGQSRSPSLQCPCPRPGGQHRPGCPAPLVRRRRVLPDTLGPGIPQNRDPRPTPHTSSGPGLHKPASGLRLPSFNQFLPSRLEQGLGAPPVGLAVG